KRRAGTKMNLAAKKGIIPFSRPSRSDTVLVTHEAYDLAGNANEITDPRNIMTQYNFDMLGRKVGEIDNSSGGSPSVSAADTDRNGNVHTLSYDILGRLKLDAVTTLGSGVDGAVRALGYNFTALGLPYQQTSYSNSSATTVVNQVQDAYNGFGQLVTEYQAH